MNQQADESLATQTPTPEGSGRTQGRRWPPWLGAPADTHCGEG